VGFDQVNQHVKDAMIQWICVVVREKFQRLINRADREDAEWMQAMKLFERMCVQLSTVPAVNAVISACEKAGQWQVALLLLSQLVEEDRMDVTSYNAAISACEKGVQWRLALQ
ncbi:Pentatricopeptide repeat-containing protein, partial [Durusdinium trenchii]